MLMIMCVVMKNMIFSHDIDIIEKKKESDVIIDDDDTPEISDDKMRVVPLGETVFYDDDDDLCSKW